MNKNAYVEVTHESHGGKGWELGTCLWVPVYGKDGKKHWRIMEEIDKGDIIFHFIRINNVYSWVGTSIATGRAIKTDTSPPEPGEYGNRPPYYRVPLGHYIPLEEPISRQYIFDNYDSQLRQIL